MKTVTLSFWGRENELAIEYDCYEGEAITENQEHALAEFLKSAESLIDSVKSEVANYCSIKSEVGKLKCLDNNIFEYVTPKSLFVKRRDKDKRVVGLLCSCKSNDEDGLAIKFENERLKKLGTQNIIL
jgi:hypothetical protein